METHKKTTLVFEGHCESKLVSETLGSVFAQKLEIELLINNLEYVNIYIFTNKLFYIFEQISLCILTVSIYVSMYEQILNKKC